MQLKKYQSRSLESLKNYLSAARLEGPSAAFERLTSSGEKRTRFQEADGLPDVPYICLRLPTGGGKTLLSTHTVKTVGDAYLNVPFPVVLWLVPTNTIRTQTLETLKKPGHPNYEVLRDAYDGHFEAFDISDFDLIRAHDIGKKTIIVVSTMAALRVTSTEGRKVYAHTEKLETHFRGIDPYVPGLETIEEGSDAGKIQFSFANLLHLNNPLVIVDEAHNASSALSFEVLRRVNSSCVVEYTATPAKNSNVLYHVSATELKAEEMIKLPIVLSEHTTWQEAIEDSVRTRDRLNELAKSDPDYIRPIALIQAENKDKEITVEVVLEHLENVCKIPREKIAVATGTQKELDGINILSPASPIEYVITIQALKEGWDCPFAYVFCSVAKVNSKKDVEQLLGRVLRMPYAKRRMIGELNKAYAHVSRSTWRNAVSLLHDQLVDMGFESHEVNYVIEQRPTAPVIPNLLTPTVVELSKMPDLSELDAQERGQVNVEKSESGFTLTIEGSVNDTLHRKLSKCLDKDDKTALTNTIGVVRAQQQRLKSPSQKGETFEVPTLCLEVDGYLELAEKELFVDPNGWKLLDYPAELVSHEYTVHTDAKNYEVDIEGYKVKERFLGYGQGILDLDDAPNAWDELELSRWLDRQLHQVDISQPIMLEFCRKTVSYLVTKRDISLSALVRTRYLLAVAMAKKIDRYREDAYKSGFQYTLFGTDNSAVRVSFDYAVFFTQDRYAPNWLYGGSYQFQKHFFPGIGELKSKGEEYECAKVIDEMAEVRYWVRNLERRMESSFWLPTATDNFYPDFVAMLDDGRIFVIEYKGEAYKTNDDSKEKNNLGLLWEEKSEGKGLFLLAVKKDDDGRDARHQILNKIGATA